MLYPSSGWGLSHLNQQLSILASMYLGDVDGVRCNFTMDGGMLELLFAYDVM